MVIFLLFKKIINREQCGFEFLRALSNLFAKLKLYICFQSSITHTHWIVFGETPLSQIVDYSQFVYGKLYMFYFFSWTKDFMLPLNDGGSLSSKTINLWGIQLLKIFRKNYLRLSCLSSYFQKLFRSWTD